MSFRPFLSVFSVGALLLVVGFTWPWEPQPKTNQNNAQDQKGNEGNAAAPKQTSTQRAGEKPEFRQVGPGETDPEILKIQQQIQTILDVNQSLQVRYGQQAGEIKKIAEQAKIHQQILHNIQPTTTRAVKVYKPVEKPTPTVVTPVQALNREKIDVIRQETEKNVQYLNELEDKDKQSAPPPDDSF